MSTYRKRGRPGRKPTLADVARKAGVSVSTVSNVVNGRVDLVQERTLERVNRVIQQVGYRPHVHARALRLSRGWAIGMLLITNKSDFVTMQWMGKLVAGLSNYLNEQGYGLLFHNHTPATIDKSVLLRRAHTDGLIAILSGPTAERTAILDKLTRFNQPLIALQETIKPIPGKDMAVARQDDFGGGVLIARHLAESGARKLVFVEPDFSWPAMAERIRGIKSVLAKVAGASLKVLKCKDEAHEYVEATVLSELKMNGLPDAFLGGNELIALAVLTTLETSGYQVPKDVLLTGFNAFDMWHFAKRKVTTIDFPAYELGVVAGKLMAERLSSRSFEDRCTTLPAALVLGDTTAVKVGHRRDLAVSSA